MAKAPAKTTRAMTRATTRTTTSGDKAPEAQRTPAAKSDTAERMFKDADEAALRGLPETMTKEQYENQVRRAATGM